MHSQPSVLCTLQRVYQTLVCCNEHSGNAQCGVYRAQYVLPPTNVFFVRGKKGILSQKLAEVWQHYLVIRHLIMSLEQSSTDYCLSNMTFKFIRKTLTLYCQKFSGSGKGACTGRRTQTHAHTSGPSLGNSPSCATDREQSAHSMLMPFKIV